MGDVAIGSSTPGPRWAGASTLLGTVYYVLHSGRYLGAFRPSCTPRLLLEGLTSLPCPGPSLPPSLHGSVSLWLGFAGCEEGGPEEVWLLRQPLLAKCKDTASGGIGRASVAKKAYFPDRAILYQAPKADGTRVLAGQARGLVSCPNEERERGECITADPPHSVCSFCHLGSGQHRFKV